MTTAAKPAAKPASKSANKSAAKSASAPATKGAGKAKAAGKAAARPEAATAAAKKATPAKAQKDAQKDAQEGVKAAKVKKVDASAKPNGAARTETSAASKPIKAKKQKLVRDSFTMPESEYALLGEVKKACLANGFEVKKSELLRVGVALIRTLDNASLKNWIQSLPPLKPGRPRKDKAA